MVFERVLGFNERDIFLSNIDHERVYIADNLIPERMEARIDEDYHAHFTFYYYDKVKLYDYKILPYSGTAYIDKENARVIKISLPAYDKPNLCNRINDMAFALMMGDFLADTTNISQHRSHMLTAKALFNFMFEVILNA